MLNQAHGGKKTQWKQWAAGITATLTMVCGGSVNGWATTNLPRLMNDDSTIKITSAESSWIVSLAGIGVMFGAIVGAVSADTFGRKKTLLLTSLFYIIGWLIQIFPTKMKGLYVARVISGAGLGMSYTVNPLYLSEIADVNIRGALGTLIAVNVFSGALFTCSIGPFLSPQTLYLVLLAIPTLFLCTFMWFPESPYYLVSKKKYEKAAESLVFFKGILNQEDIEKELELLTASYNEQSENLSWSGKFRDMLLPNNRKAVIILVCLIITQLMSGNYTTTAYLEVLFKNAGIGISTDLATAIVLLVGLISCTMSTVLIEKVGRRPLLMTSSLGTCVTLIMFASYLMAETNGVNVQYFNWLPIAAVVVFQLVYQIGIGPVPEALIGELFPSNVKSIGSAFVTVIEGTLIFLVAKLYQVIGDAVGEYVVYYVFAAFCFLCFLFTILFIPETLNKEFNEIQEKLLRKNFCCFKKNNGA